jgi:hypothetical protein
VIESIAVIGKKKRAKTAFLLSAPKPLVIFDFENGVRRVEDRFKPDFDKVKVVPLIPENPYKRKKNPELAIGFWDRILEEYVKALEDAEVRSISFDVWTSAWEARRLAYAAELHIKNLMPQHYPPLNAEFKQMLVQAQTYGKVLLLSEHTRPLYDKDGNETGEEEADGFKYTGDLVDVELWMDKKDGHPVATIRTCGLSMSAEGLEVENPTFEKIDKLIEGYRSL